MSRDASCRCRQGVKVLVLIGGEKLNQVEPMPGLLRAMSWALRGFHDVLEISLTECDAPGFPSGTVS
jgi:hypothetical protein